MWLFRLGFLACSFLGRPAVVPTFPTNPIPNRLACRCNGASFAYDSERGRYKMVATGLNAGTTYHLTEPTTGASEEEFVAGGTTTWRDYIEADGKLPVSWRTLAFVFVGVFVLGCAASGSKYERFGVGGRAMLCLPPEEVGSKITGTRPTPSLFLEPRYRDYPAVSFLLSKTQLAVVTPSFHYDKRFGQYFPSNVLAGTVQFLDAEGLTIDWSGWVQDAVAGRSRTPYGFAQSASILGR